MREAKMLVEKRIQPRISTKLQVKYRLLDEGTRLHLVQDRMQQERVTHTVDISLGGAFVLLEEKLDLGSVLRLSIKLPEDDLTVTAYAQVTWTNRTGCGLHFWSMKDSDREILRGYLAEISSSSPLRN
jgi:hypothetical protein